MANKNKGIWCARSRCPNKGNPIAFEVLQKGGVFCSTICQIKDYFATVVGATSLQQATVEFVMMMEDEY